MTPPRRLIVLRHAKAVGAGPGGGDHGRHLEAQGRREAAEVGLLLGAHGWMPDRVVSSDSQRTRETWEAVAPALSSSVTADFDARLYLADVEQIESILSGMDEACRTVLVLGHNPGLSDAVTRWTGIPVDLATSEVALLEGAPVGWAQVGTVRWRVVELLRSGG